MAIFEIRTFVDMQSAVREELKVQSGDTTSINRIKRTINDIYINEVAPYERWKWLRKTVDLTHDAKINVGTASVTLGDRTITLTDAPVLSQRGNWFSAKNHKERYRVAQHVAGATTLELESDFTGATNGTVNYTLWSDFVALPSDCRETFEVTQDFLQEPVSNVGLQKFRSLVSIQPKAETRPRFYTTDDWVDPDPYATISGIPALSTRASAGRVKTLVYAADVSSLLSAGDRIDQFGSITAGSEFWALQPGTNLILIESDEVGGVWTIAWTPRRAGI